MMRTAMTAMGSKAIHKATQMPPQTTMLILQTAFQSMTPPVAPLDAGV